jgi:hypothetical protein
MKARVKLLLAVALILTAATGAWAQAAGNWQKMHGQVQVVQGNQLTLKADDGRVMNVDMSQVSQSVQGAMAPNLGVTVTGFPGTSPHRFTARYIEEDATSPVAGRAAVGNNAVDRVLPLVPQFVDSKEFQDRAASFHNNRVAARRFVTQLYQGFSTGSRTSRSGPVSRYPLRSDWTIVSFAKFRARRGQSRRVITDLYKGVWVARRRTRRSAHSGGIARR